MKLLAADISLEPQVYRALSINNARKTYVIYEPGLDPEKSGTFDQAALDAWPAAGHPAIPSSWQYELCLDWEGKWLDNLLGFNGAEAQKHAVEQGIMAIDAVLKRWPDSKPGFYSLPGFHYWSQHDDGKLATLDEWFARAQGYQALLDRQLAFFPTVYDFYKTGQSEEADDLQYCRNAVLHGLIQAGGRGVFPMVWHRYHDSNAAWGLHRIPDDELINHVSAALRTRYRGRGVRAPIWWSEERTIRNYAKWHLSDTPIADPNVAQIAPQAAAAMIAENLPGMDMDQSAAPNQLAVLQLLGRIARKH